MPRSPLQTTVTSSTPPACGTISLATQLNIYDAVTINDLTIAHGNPTTGNLYYSGGGIRFAPGNTVSLTIDRVVFDHTLRIPVSLCSPTMADPPQTMALLEGSAAIDTGPPSVLELHRTPTRA